jgi:hypothetical protein
MQAHPKIFGLSLIFLVLTGTLSSYATDFSDCASSARRLRGAAEDAESAQSDYESAKSNWESARSSYQSACGPYGYARNDEFACGQYGYQGSALESAKDRLRSAKSRLESASNEVDSYARQTATRCSVPSSSVTTQFYSALIKIKQENEGLRAELETCQKSLGASSKPEGSR